MLDKEKIDAMFAKAVAAELSEIDTVNHPAYYNDSNIEVIDYILDKQLDFCLGNAVKYISRAGKKDPDKKIEDLEKAVWYIQKEIELIKND